MWVFLDDKVPEKYNNKDTLVFTFEFLRHVWLVEKGILIASKLYNKTKGNNRPIFVKMQF